MTNSNEIKCNLCNEVTIFTSPVDEFGCCENCTNDYERQMAASAARRAESKKKTISIKVKK